MSSWVARLRSEILMRKERFEQVRGELRALEDLSHRMILQADEVGHLIEKWGRRKAIDLQAEAVAVRTRVRDLARDAGVELPDRRQRAGNL